MSTQDQLDANRTNAQSSTGPKTDAGKAASSQNAVKHGLFAKNDVISGEDLARYEEHRTNIYDEYFPTTPTESVLTQRIASLTWRLMRADRLQATVINTLVAAQQKATPPPVREIFNISNMIKSLRFKVDDPDYPLTDAEIICGGLVHRKHEPDTHDPAVDEAMEAALAPPVNNHICNAEIQLGTVIYNDFHGSAVIERLQSYEQRIESSLFKTIRQFQQMQDIRARQDLARNKREWESLCIEAEERKNRREDEYARDCNCGHGRDSDYDVDPPDPSHKSSAPPFAQNEPNSDLTPAADTTYNKNHQEKANRKDSGPQKSPQPDPHPGRNANK
jgi:hypothetical protein